jgi:hypothetical protein
VRNTAKRTIGPYTIEAVSSCGRKPISIDVDGTPIVTSKDVGGFASVRLFDKRLAQSYDNPEGFVSEKRFQADTWDEVDAEFVRLRELVERMFRAEGGIRVLTNVS